MVQTVTPLPLHGEVIIGRDVAGRVLRISGHPGLDRVVLSIWDGGRCMGTVRVAGGDVPDLVRALVSTIVPERPQVPGPVEAPAAGLRRGAATATARAWAGRARDYVRHRLASGQ